MEYSRKNCLFSFSQPKKKQTISEFDLLLTKYLNLTYECITHNTAFKNEFNRNIWYIFWLVEFYKEYINNYRKRNIHNFMNHICWQKFVVVGGVLFLFLASFSLKIMLSTPYTFFYLIGNRVQNTFLVGMLKIKNWNGKKKFLKTFFLFSLLYSLCCFIFLFPAFWSSYFSSHILWSPWHFYAYKWASVKTNCIYCSGA